MQSRGVSLTIVAGALTLALLWTAGARAQTSEATASVPPPSADAAPPVEAPAPASYYVEFRVAQIGLYGHSYAVYGRLNANGQPADAHYADLHPTGSYLLMAVGHVVPVPANTTWNPEVLTLPVASSYRRKLNAAEYQKLLLAVKRARANKQPTWNALTNNCNHFIAQLANAVGLKTPSDLKVSYTFVPAIREMNEGAGGARPAPVRRAPAASHAPAAAPRT